MRDPALCSTGVLIAVDPGIDVASAAVYDLARVGRAAFLGSLDGAARGFLRVVRMTTDRRADTLERCAALSAWLKQLVVQESPAYVVIEVPAHAGTYEGKLGRQKGKSSLNAAALEKMNRAIGAIGAGAHAGVGELLVPAQVVEHRSNYGRYFREKPPRHEAMNAALRRVGMAEIRGNEDDRDAAFLGAFYIATKLIP